MLRRILQFAFAAFLLLPNGAGADPIKLKFSFFTSDRSSIYQCQIKPFVDAVNTDGKGVVEIVVYFSGAISTKQDQQDQLVKSGQADLALAVPSYSPQRFPDTAVVELPGLFASESDASRVFTRLIEAGALQGYGDFALINGFVSAGESIHSRKPIGTLADLKGQTIRVSSDIEAAALRELGAVPIFLPLNQATDALAAGKIDGAMLPPAMLFEFGFGRLTSHHYLIHLGGVPTAVVMNRQKLAGLPPQAQEILRKHSGERMSQDVAACFSAKNREVLAQLKADPRRQLVVPSPSDAAIIKRVFANVRAQWAASSSHQRELLARVQAEIAALHAAER